MLGFRYLALLLFLGSFALWGGMTAATYLRGRPEPQPRERAASPARGRQDYATYCQTCHGDQGRGDGMAAKLGIPGVADLTGAHARALTDAQIFDIITHGKGKMEGYAESLSAPQRRDIAAHVRFLQQQAPSKP
ncbi:MAG: cytochrome c [Verrucomicrobium sp.]|nr:cytochrome c [Verrucomicrobium sp.]